MKYPRTKSAAITLWGDKYALAAAIGVTRQAIDQWPQKLTERKINEILGASIRAGLIK